MYTLDITTGIVTRDSDGVQVAPCQFVSEQNFIDYNNWVNVGNVPTIKDIPIVDVVISASDFRNRFTDVELGQILSKAYSGDATCQLLLLKVQTANDGITLTSQTTIQGINYLVSIGVLTSTRANIILQP